MTIGDRIRKERELAGISQTDLAEKIKISKQTLYKYEKNIITNIPSDKIEAIAKALNISESYLMGWSEEISNISNSEAEFNKVFSKRLRYYLTEYGFTQSELAKRLNVSTQSVTNWCKGTKSPRMDKVDAMCEIFNCTRADLVQEPNKSDYYYNDETKEIAQQIFESKELSLLFDAARDASPEDLQTVHTMLLALKNKEKNN